MLGEKYDVLCCNFCQYQNEQETHFMHFSVQFQLERLRNSLPVRIFLSYAFARHTIKCAPRHNVHEHITVPPGREPILILKLLLLLRSE